MTIDIQQWQRAPLVRSLFWLISAGPLVPQVMLSIPDVTVFAGDSSAVVPVALANEQDEVRGCC